MRIDVVMLISGLDEEALDGIFDPEFYIRHAHTVLKDAGITTGE